MVYFGSGTAGFLSVLHLFLYVASLIHSISAFPLSYSFYPYQSFYVPDRNSPESLLLFPLPTLLRQKLASFSQIMGPQLITAYHYLQDEEEAEGSEKTERYNASTDSLIASNIPTLRQSVHARCQWNLAGSVAVLLMLFLTNFLTAVSVHWVDVQDGRLIKQTSFYCMGFPFPLWHPSP
jgi:hypothetical protein